MHLPSAFPLSLSHCLWLRNGPERLGNPSHSTNIYFVVVLHQAPKLGAIERSKTCLHPSRGSSSRGHD